MDDLISRAAAIEAVIDWTVKPDGEIFNAIKTACRSKIEQIPAAKAMPVVHGRWYDKGSISCRCSYCGCKSNAEYSYCPNCGARMDGEQRDGE